MLRTCTRSFAILLVCVVFAGLPKAPAQAQPVTWGEIKHWLNDLRQVQDFKVQYRQYGVHPNGIQIDFTLTDAYGRETHASLMTGNNPPYTGYANPELADRYQFDEAEVYSAFVEEGGLHPAQLDPLMDVGAAIDDTDVASEGDSLTGEDESGEESGYEDEDSNAGEDDAEDGSFDPDDGFDDAPPDVPGEGLATGE